MSPENFRAKVQDQRKQAHLAKLILDGACHIWGMAAEKTFIGMDMMGMSVLRWTFAGFRRLVLIRAGALKDIPALWQTIRWSRKCRL